MSKFRLAIVGDLSSIGEGDITEDNLCEIINNTLNQLYPKVVIVESSGLVSEVASKIANMRGISLFTTYPEHDRWLWKGQKTNQKLIALDCTHLLHFRDYWSDNSRNTYIANLTGSLVNSDGTRKVVICHVL